MARAVAVAGILTLAVTRQRYQQPTKHSHSSDRWKRRDARSWNARRNAGKADLVEVVDLLSRG